MKFLNFFSSIFEGHFCPTGSGSETLDSNKSYEYGSTRIRNRNNAQTTAADVDKDLRIVTFGRRKKLHEKADEEAVWAGDTWQCGEQQP
jgi:hypothetical protein